MLNKFTFRQKSHMSFVGMFFLICLCLYFLGRPLMVVLVSLIWAYLLSEPQAMLEKKLRSPALAAGLLTTSIWVSILGVVLWLVPLLLLQVASLIKQYPHMHEKMIMWIVQFSSSWGAKLEIQSIENFLLQGVGELSSYAMPTLHGALSIIPSLIEVIIYIFIVPMMVFFLLRDRALFVAWVKSEAPKDLGFFSKFWQEVDAQLGHYLRGKVVEVLLVAIISMGIFQLFSFKYSLLLGLLSGLSTLVPIFGAFLATVPLVILSWMQWGYGVQLWGILGANMVIIFLDSHLLVPLLFAEKLSMHPFAILVAIMFFGSIWGFWGLFFAIPLATVVQALLNVRKA